MKKLTPELYRRVVDEKLNMVKLLYKNNPDGDYAINRPCFSPFHDNTNTPSGMIYENDGKTTMYCFSKRRLYTPSDAVELLLKQDVLRIGEHLFNSMSYYEQNLFLNKYNNSDIITAESFDDKVENKQIKKQLALFKYGQIDYSTLLDKLLE